jgi:hypothetical protein
MPIDAINNHPHLQRYKILYVPGNYSRMPSSLNRMTERTLGGHSPAFQLTNIMGKRSSIHW